MAQVEIRVDGQFQRATDDAILLLVDMGGRIGEVEAWIPRSQILFKNLKGVEDYEDLEEGDEIVVFIPEWLAKKKDLV